MPQEDDLLRAICERPDDDKPRVAYAEWLDEHASGPSDPAEIRDRARYIRVQIGLADGTDPDRAALLWPR